MASDFLAGDSNFSHLMWLYEKNYQLARNLLGGLPAHTVEAEIQNHPQNLPLYARQLEHQTHTETWHLTHFFHDGHQDIADPDIEVRLYHDTKQAECWRVGQHDHLDTLRHFNTNAQDAMERRWQRNIMLFKWLRLLATETTD